MACVVCLFRNPHPQGTEWGEDGFFRIERGSNMLKVESDCYWATPDLTKIPQLKQPDVVV
jgi:hypothetical protein